MFIGILTALQSHDLAESMLVGLAAGAWCLHVYMYTYTRLLARHVTFLNFTCIVRFGTAWPRPETAKKLLERQTRKRQQGLLGTAGDRAMG